MLMLCGGGTLHVNWACDTMPCIGSSWCNLIGANSHSAGAQIFRPVASHYRVVPPCCTNRLVAFLLIAPQLLPAQCTAATGTATPHGQRRNEREAPQAQHALWVAGRQAMQQPVTLTQQLGISQSL